MATNKAYRRQSFGVSCLVEGQQEALYTCPANCRAEVEMLFITNPNGNTSVNVRWYRAATDDYIFLLGGKNLTTGEYILLTGATLVLEPGDEIDVTPSGNSTPHIDATCTAVETFIPVG